MIRFGLIGAGRLGKVHAANIAQLEKLAGIEASLVAVYDPKPEAAQFMHDTYGATICQGPEDVAQFPDLDAVVIASPTYCHQDGIRAAVAANKFIFSEKPFCRDLETGKSLLELLKDYPKFFPIGFVRRAMSKSALHFLVLAMARRTNPMAKNFG